MEAYFEALEAGADACYELVGRARKAGYDLEDEAEPATVGDGRQPVEERLRRQHRGEEPPVDRLG